MKTRILLTLLVTSSLFAQAGAINEITFSWDEGKQTQTGFQKTRPEIDRFDTLKINVPASFTDNAAKQLSANAPPSPLVDEIKAFTQLAAALRDYTDAITAAVAEQPDVRDISLHPKVVEARKPLAQSLRTFIAVVRPIDPERYQRVADAFTRGYPAVAKELQNEIEDLNAKLVVSARDAGAVGMTATIVPLEADARPLHLPGYDNNVQSSVAAVPTFIPVVDDRTLAEAKAAQTLVDTTKQLGQLRPELEKSLRELQQQLVNLRETLKTDVLEKNLTELETDLQTAVDTDVTLIARVKAARTLVQTLNSANLTLAGSTDIDKLLGVANSLSDTSNALIQAGLNLPSDLRKLVTDVEALAKKRAGIVKSDTITAIKNAANDFMSKQQFFISFGNNIKSLASQFSANNDAALSAQRLESTALSITKTPDLNTSLDLSRIAGDVHVQDRIVVQAALYRRNDDNSLTAIEDGQQSFTVQRYGIFPDNVRAGILFVQPRSHIERDINYQPVPALGYYWRYGVRNHPVWNAASPSVGFTMTLLDFKDSADIELGFAAGVSLFRDIVWTGYGRNLQAKANYFYIGTNPLLVAKMIRR